MMGSYDSSPAHISPLTQAHKWVTAWAYKEDHNPHPHRKLPRTDSKRLYRPSPLHIDHNHKEFAFGRIPLLPTRGSCIQTLAPAQQQGNRHPACNRVLRTIQSRKLRHHHMGYCPAQGYSFLSVWARKWVTAWVHKDARIRPRHRKLPRTVLTQWYTPTHSHIGHSHNPFAFGRIAGLPTRV